MSMEDCVANFPEDIKKEILLRCPVKSLLRFKCVCKNWYALIKTPDFVQQHLKNRSAPKLLIYDNGDIDDDDDSRSITLISEENPQTFPGMTNLIDYVDGLFLMYGEINSVTSCALWNPATREVRPLHFPAPIIYDAPSFGLGIDPLTNDYKVVYFLYYSPDYAAAVYSCRRDSWRIFKIEDFDKPPQFNKEMRRTYGTSYLNGAYYWLLSENMNISTILLFDFGREMFEEIKGPDGHSVYSFALGMMLLDDSIAILNTNVDERFSYDIWVMIQPGVWNKLVTFQCFQLCKSCYDSSLILVTRASRLVSYNVRTNKIRHLGFQHPRLKNDAEHGHCGVFYYKESLITIKQQEDGELDH